MMTPPTKQPIPLRLAKRLIAPRSANTDPIAIPVAVVERYLPAEFHSALWIANFGDWLGTPYPKRGGRVFLVNGADLTPIESLKLPDGPFHHNSPDLWILPDYASKLQSQATFVVAGFSRNLEQPLFALLLRRNSILLMMGDPEPTKATLIMPAAATAHENLEEVGSVMRDFANFFTVESLDV